MKTEEMSQNDNSHAMLFLYKINTSKLRFYWFHSANTIRSNKQFSTKTPHTSVSEGRRHRPVSVWGTHTHCLVKLRANMLHSCCVCRLTVVTSALLPVTLGMNKHPRCICFLVSDRCSVLEPGGTRLQVWVLEENAAISPAVAIPFY